MKTLRGEEKMVKRLSTGRKKKERRFDSCEREEEIMRKGES